MNRITAQLNGLRMSPRKVRLVVGLIRGKRVDMAMDQLSVVAKRASMPIVKLLNSAVANARNNFKLDADHLWIKEFRVDEGVKLKRFRAKGFGRTSPIEKKTSRLLVVLEHRAPAAKKAKAVAPAAANPITS